MKKILALGERVVVKRKRGEFGACRQRGMKRGRRESGCKEEIMCCAFVGKGDVSFLRRLMERSHVFGPIAVARLILTLSRCDLGELQDFLSYVQGYDLIDRLTSEFEPRHVGMIASGVARCEQHVCQQIMELLMRDIRNIGEVGPKPVAMIANAASKCEQHV